LFAVGVARWRGANRCGVGFDDRFRLGMAEFDRVTRMSGVGFGPPSRWPLVEKSLTVGALLAVDDPRGDAVGKVAGMAFVVEGELFEGLIAGVQRIEFVL
jgi:hypothetical protein